MPDTGFALNAGQMIRESLLDINAISDFDVLTTNQIDDGIRKFNILINHLQGEGIVLNRETSYNADINLTTQNTTVLDGIGTTATVDVSDNVSLNLYSGVINDVSKIHSIWYTNTDKSIAYTPINIIPYDTYYDMIKDESISGEPTHCVIEYTQNHGTDPLSPNWQLVIRFVPGTIIDTYNNGGEYNLRFAYIDILDSIVTQNDPLQIDRKAYLMLMKGLSWMLCSSYGIPQSEKGFIYEEFKLAKREYKSGDTLAIPFREKINCNKRMIV